MYDVFKLLHMRDYLDNRVLLSKTVLGCPRKFDATAHMKFEHQISDGTYHT